MSFIVVVLTFDLWIWQFSIKDLIKAYQHFTFSCLAIQCEVPANPDNGRAVYASVSYNSLISYECTYGYMLIGDSVRRCERNKEWTGKQPHCKGNTQTHSKKIRYEFWRAEVAITSQISIIIIRLNLSRRNVENER